MGPRRAVGEFERTRQPKERIVMYPAPSRLPEPFKARSLARSRAVASRSWLR
jgi:hypothetical protein